MTLKEVIKKIISIFLPSSEIKNNGDYSLSFLSNNKLVEVKNVTNNFYQVNIDPSKINEEQEKELIKVYPEIRENNGLLLENKRYEIFKEHREECINTPILKFFKGKLKNEDYEALRISVYIKKKFSENEEIKPYLDDLHNKYGKRGNNINNLYGEGYFDSFIKLYYLSLEEEGRLNEFEKFFDKFVMEQPITYFVNQNKSQEKMNEELFLKIGKNKNYGIKRINIHGIGKLNANKINDFSEIIKTREDVKVQSLMIEETRAYLILEII
jgi:hypothetical protein